MVMHITGVSTVIPGVGLMALWLEVGVPIELGSRISIFIHGIDKNRALESTMPTSWRQRHDSDVYEVICRCT